MISLSNICFHGMHNLCFIRDISLRVLWTCASNE